ncbi:non-ribosomal peptide synthetase/type I polyketide synthase [Aliiglaciecola litoralis]|uniref:Uncharacterized protein n=1 Tax=Aliiglaciecola litoralis TaxID=582857 RepID=A0ABN1LJI2_9ALTE
MSDLEDRYSGFEIAVIGIACRFPGADSPEAFWDNLNNGVESIRRFSQQELIDLGHDPQVVSQANFVPAHGVVNNYDMFDHKLFGYTPREAGVMDPQQRLFLELSWEALENAGYAPKSMQVPVGIFAGTSTNTYLEANVRKNHKVLAAISEFQANVLNQSDFLSTRASYKLGLSGPSFTIQSACSTSLVATHVACQQLIAGACDIAMAGGVSITLPENWGYQYQEGMIYSPDGHCHAFDADANGTLKGDGGGIVVLKRLADAINDGDHIEAIILGSASNNDAQAKVGYTAPGMDGQVDVIQTAMLMADVTADSITNIECHGTGTPMGDPIEISALSKAFANEAQIGSCAVGSVKTNIGHLDAGAGVAGLIKTVLALKHKTLPPSLNYQRPNPIIEFEKTPFYVNYQSTPWKSGRYPRRGGVSSFGIGGTNAHIIVEETPEDLLPEIHEPPENPILLGWSAQSKKGLDQYAEKLIKLLTQDTSPALRDIAFTLHQGREKFAFRRALVCSSKQDALAKLQEHNLPSVVSSQIECESTATVFMFPGQGSQYINMGRDLYDNQPIFKQQVDLCAELLLPHLQFDIRHILYPQDAQQKSEGAEKLTQTACTQPALFVIEYGLAKLWQANGLEPSIVVGHSIGEYAAACIAGVFSLEDALMLVARRGALMQALPAGDMLSVQSSVDDVEPFLDDSLSIAALNSPALCVVSGPTNRVAELVDILAAENIACKRLNTSHAFHSGMMEPILAPFLETLDCCTLHAPSIPIVSTVTGDLIDSQRIRTPQYWLDNIRQSVNFASAANTLMQQNNYTYLECGPGNTLSSLLRSCSDKPAQVQCVSSLKHPLETASDNDVFEAAQAKLWTTGIHLPDTLTPPTGRRVAIPTYPFQRTKCWVEPLPENVGKLALAYKQNIDIKQPLDKWFYVPSWQSWHSPMTSSPISEESWLLVSANSKRLGDLTKTLTEQGVASITSIVYSSGSPLDLTQINNHKSAVQQITHLAILTEQGSELDLSTAPTSHAFYDLLNVLQPLLNLLDLTKINLSYVTTLACAMNPMAAVDPQRLMPLGLLRSIKAEYPGINLRFINLAEEVNEQDLLREMRVQGDAMLVNFEFGNCWTQVLQPTCLPDPKVIPLRFKTAATYLITGGLGSMGLAFAHYLVENFQANLILVSRQTLPEDDDAKKWLAQNPDDNPTAKKLHAISQLKEKSSGEICVLAADVSDLRAMQQLKQTIQDRFGGIDGVIHAAGIPGGGIVANLQQGEIEDVFAAKVKGTWGLCETFADQSLDFLILCSSLTSFIDRPGRGEYAAANYYLDALANSNLYTNNTPIISINWDAWSGSTMSQAAGAPSAEGRIDPQQGTEAMVRCLHSGLRQAVVSTRNLMPSYGFISGLEEASSANELRSVDEHAEIEDPSLSPAERILMSIWHDLLGVEEVTTQDNFFELGGDSIVSLQLTSRAAQQGLKITARQVFENQTIAELAILVEDQVTTNTKSVAVTEQTSSNPINIVCGEVPLTPIQNWFFANDFNHPQHWNLYQVLALPKQIETPQLRKLLDIIIQQHDMLRAQFYAKGSQWTQQIQDYVSIPDDGFLAIDVSSWKKDDYQQRLEHYVNELSAQFDLNGGCLYRFVHLQNSHDNSAQLLVLIHHLLIDIVSLNILVNDLLTAWQQLSTSKAIQLAPKSSSFKHWSNALLTFAESTDCVSQREYWQRYQGLTPLPLPKDVFGLLNNVESAQQSTVLLSSSVTKQLTKELVKFGVQPKDVLLCGLLMAMADFTGQSRLLIELEEHGRDALDSELDMSRTVGWFTKAFPFFCEVPSQNDAKSAVESIRLKADYASDFGLGFGLCAAELSLPKPEVVFLYLGNVSQSSTLSAFSPTTVCKASRHPTQQRTHTFEFSVWIAKGQVNINLGYSENYHHVHTIETLLNNYKALVESLVARLTPSLDSLFPVGEPDSVSLQENAPPEQSDLLPLSFAQERVWFLEQIEQQSTLHNKHSVLKISGKLNHQHLRDAINAILASHQSLRTCFAKQAGEPRQKILQSVKIDLPIENFDSQMEMSGAQKIEDILSIISEHEIAQPFDLQQGPLLRFKLLKQNEANHYLLITIHHIVVDAWSMQLFFKQLQDAYQQLANGLPPAITTSSQYTDFVTWQRAAMDTPQLSQSLDYWCQKLAGIPTRLTLPTDRPRPPLQTFEGDRVDLSLSAHVITKVRAFCIANGVSVNMVMLAIFKVLLAKYSGQTDIVVGTPVANRSKREFESIIGLLVNNLVLRSDLSPDKTFKQLLSHVKNEVLDANEHADVPFEKVVQAINPERDRSQSPLFQVMMVFMNAPQGDAPESHKNIINMQPEEVHNRISEFDLSLYVYEKGSQYINQAASLNAWIEFNTQLFDKQRIEQFCLHYCYLLEQATDNPQIKIKQLQLLTQDQQSQMILSQSKNQLPFSFAQTHSPDADTSLEYLLTAKLSQNNHPKALRCGSDSLSYQQLEQQSASLAKQLQDLGAEPEVPIAIYMDRSIDMLVAMLAVLRSGACYVPLDPSFPKDRIDYMLRDAEAKLLLSNEALFNTLTDCPCDALLVDNWQRGEEGSEPLQSAAKSTDLAYIIYTSGSTGMPKGVRIERRNVVNFLLSMALKPGLNEQDVFVAVTTISFDIHVLELWLPLVVGAQLVIAESSQTADGNKLLDLLQTCQATVMQATPATWQLLLQCGWSKPLELRALCGGEALTNELCNKLLPLTQCIWNMYGPTETCVWSSVKQITTASNQITIGEPIHNTQFYVVDNNMNMLPAGITGELLIGGEGVVRDYYKRQELTENQFVENPIKGLRTGRVYRTGDAAQRLPNGEFTVLGRFDNQVKLRGYRIELGEIEMRLSAHPAVSEAVVGIRGEEESKKLVAWLRPSSDSPPSNLDLRDFLLEVLPNYMVPATFVWLDEFAKTPNNKIDRKALVEPSIEYELPALIDALETDAERLVANVFGEVLNTSQVGRFDNFFDLGGHSLLSMKVVDGIERETGVRIHPGELFQQSVGQIASIYQDQFVPQKESSDV